LLTCKVSTATGW